MKQPLSMDDMYDLVDWLDAGSLDAVAVEGEGEDDDQD